jgi:hypothetical protein
MPDATGPPLRRRGWCSFEISKPQADPTTQALERQGCRASTWHLATPRTEASHTSAATPPCLCFCLSVAHLGSPPLSPLALLSLAWAVLASPPAPRASLRTTSRGALVVIGRPRGAEILDLGRPGPPRGGRRGLAVTHRGVGDVTGQIWASSTSFEAHQDLRGVVPQSLLGPQGVLGRGKSPWPNGFSRRTRLSHEILPKPAGRGPRGFRSRGAGVGAGVRVLGGGGLWFVVCGFGRRRRSQKLGAGSHWELKAESSSTQYCGFSVCGSGALLLAAHDA